jgi:hypothetical protein
MIVGNKVVSRREYAKLRNLHEIRLKTMKPVVDMSPPGSFTSRVSNGKKVFNQEGDGLYRKMHRNRKGKSYSL